MNRFHAVRRRRVSAAAALLAAGALFAVPAARADFPFPPTPREVHREVSGLVHDVLRMLDRIPLEIHGEFAGDLNPFLVGNVYFGPHRHYHETYSFPVWIDGAVSYRPYIYCNHRLYGDYGNYSSRPQFWSDWGEASQGSWCDHHHAYYPTSHACFRPQYRQQYRPQYGPRYDSHYRSGYSSQYGSGHRADHGGDSRYYSAPRTDSRYDGRYGSHNDSRYGSHNGRRNDSRYDSQSRSYGRPNDHYRAPAGSNHGRTYGSRNSERSRNDKHPSQDRKGHDDRDGQGRNRH